ncbi:MAG: CPBP family intramembrane metalloprotease [Clostridia bacterium]|nr:CPBP family intramembrane metalloprotease [Clostridia bacterium]
MKLRKVEFIEFESKGVITQKTWLVIMMAAMVYYAYTMIISFISLFAMIIKNPGALANGMQLLESDGFKILYLFLTAIGILIALLYVRFMERRSLTSTGITKEKLSKNYFSGYLIGILMISLPVAVLALFKGSIEISDSFDYTLILLCFFGFLVQGASEEIMMRGYILTSLAKTAGLIWAVVITSFGFAALHLLNPNMGVLPFANLVLFGLFAAFLFLRTGNIWTISALHSAWNFFQGNVFGIEVSGQVFGGSLLKVTSAAPAILSGGDFGLEGGLIVTIILILSTLLVLFAGKSKLVIGSGTHESDLVGQ